MRKVAYAAGEHNKKPGRLDKSIFNRIPIPAAITDRAKAILDANSALRGAIDAGTLPKVERNHRLNSMLQIVSSLASQTARHSQTLEEFVPAFSGRLLALAQVQTSHSQGSPLCDLKEILEEACLFDGVEEDRIRNAAGASVIIPKHEALSLRLALNELFTNARRYGALSIPGGRVEVSWKITADDGARVYMIWKECGGPRVKRPSKRGFGIQMLELLLPYDLQGKADLRFEPDGFQYRIEFPAPESPAAWETLEAG